MLESYGMHHNHYFTRHPSLFVLFSNKVIRIVILTGPYRTDLYAALYVSVLKWSPLVIWLNLVTLVIPSKDPVFHPLAIHNEKMVGGELMATDEGGYEISHHLSV